MLLERVVGCLNGVYAFGQVNHSCSRKLIKNTGNEGIPVEKL